MQSLRLSFTYSNPEGRLQYNLILKTVFKYFSGSLQVSQSKLKNSSSVLRVIQRDKLRLLLKGSLLKLNLKGYLLFIFDFSSFFFKYLYNNFLLIILLI